MGVAVSYGQDTPVEPRYPHSPEITTDPTSHLPPTSEASDSIFYFTLVNAVGLRF